jgi:DNA repair protein RadC
MDLRNQTITVAELLENPKSRAVFQRRFGKWMKHPMVGAAKTLTLRQLAEMAAVYLPQKTIQDTIRELERL